MPNSPRVLAPAFGKWLADQRGDRSHEAVAVQIRPLVEGLGIKVNRSSVLAWEAGRIPPWPVLDALAFLFRTSPLVVAGMVISAAQWDGRDLLRHKADQAFSSSGGLDAATFVAVVTERDRLKAALDQVHDVAQQLVEIAAADQDRHTGIRAAGRGGSHRKTR